MGNTFEPVTLFKEHFPNINIEGLNHHGEVEQEVCKHLREFTKEQWAFLLSYKASDLFQDGIPHISWNTDRHLIAWQLRKDYKVVTSEVWDETWYKVTLSWYEVLPGFFIKVKYEQPRTFGNGCHSHWNLSITEEAPVVNTHSAVILGINRDGEIFIQNNTTGTLNACEDWVTQQLAKLGRPGQYTFKIMKRNED